MPRVTVLMPLFNGREYIEESLKSIQAQTYSDWEFIIVNDFGSNDGCAEIIKQYAEKDCRIKLIQAETRLGLAASLNIGLDMAAGEYIARVDADDPSEPKRLEKQVAFLDEHPEITLCSCWQRAITPDRVFVQKVASNPQELKTAMIFGCEISHCGVMFRKEDFDSHGWRYDPNAFGEDFELWTRAMHEGAIMANIPEPLVSHRWGFGNTSITKGEKLRDEVRELSMRSLNWLGVQTENYDRMLFSGWRNRPEDYAKKNRELFLKQGFRLIQEILKANDKEREYEEKALNKMLVQRWDWIRKSCGLNYKEFQYGQFDGIVTKPRVSVVLPTFNSATDISQAIDSVLEQTYSDWELLVINDFGSDDGTAEIVKMYAMNDPRIQLIQAKVRLGLAESLNVGMRKARGEYIARLDADDTALPERFAKQVTYMDEHPEIGVCGTWQKHYGRDSVWIHKAETNPQKLKCKLLFWCDLCHSTLMLRKNVFLENDLFYDSNAQAEDFELWTRAMEHTQLVSIPEVLGTYNEGTGITSSKIKDLSIESGIISARILEHNLDIRLSERDKTLLSSWINPISHDENREWQLNRLKELLTEIWERNNTMLFFDSRFLLQILAAKWFWCKDNIDWKTADYRNVKNIDSAFSDKYKPSMLFRYRIFMENNPSTSVRMKKLAKHFFRPLAWFSRKAIKALMKDALTEINCNIENWTWDRYCRTNKAIENWTWERYQRTESNRQYSLVAYHENEPIRVLFVIQVASFWPAQEEVYLSMKADNRFETVIVCYDDDFDHSIKTDSTREYLRNNNYEFIPWEAFSFEDFNPHIVFLQTAYDSNRKGMYISSNIRKYGSRPVYIPYGIEIANTLHARHDHFRWPIIRNAWKLYTFSNEMRREYQAHINSMIDIVATGLPRFDSLFHKERFPQRKEVVASAKGRKTILWKVHFPKVIHQLNQTILVTPDINEYIKFAECIEKDHSDLFFVFMPHPRFREFNDDEKVRAQTQQLIAMLETKSNVFIDEYDDYRPSLLHADAIIVDRSAVMIEAAVVDVPILYMSNADYYEPMTAAVTPLVESYEQGQTYADMVGFIQRCREGQDIKHEERNDAFHHCIPYFDGKCAERIKEDIIQSLIAEQDQPLERQIMKQTSHLEARLASLEEQMAEMLEQKANQELLPRIDKSVERWTWDRFKRLRLENEELRRQIDFSYRDILVALEKQLEFIGQHNLELHTDFPIAYESLDTLVPHGTIRDNTRYPRFIKKCEKILGQDRGLSFLDLGCSGGGMVLDAILRGHLGIGLEGSDASLNAQRAEWRLLRDNLFTCDISKPFALVDKNTQEKAQFHIITAWEVLEHIAEEDLPQLCTNIKNHLSPDGYFIASIANYDDIDPDTGVNWHVTKHPYEWWKECFENAGFSIQTELIDTIDLARGGYNPPNAYIAPSATVDKERCFHIVVQKTK